MNNNRYIYNFYIADLKDKMDNGGITDNTGSQNKLNMETKATVLQKDVSMLLVCGGQS